MNKEKTPNGIEFEEYIGSINGADFVLFPEDKHSEEDIKRAKAQLRANRDVLTVKVATMNDLIDDYKKQIFRQPEVKPLKWFQVEQDEKLLKSEFLAGVTPKDFVNKHVLPFTKRTEKRFLIEYGKSIYDM